MCMELQARTHSNSLGLFPNANKGRRVTLCFGAAISAGTRDRHDGHSSIKLYNCTIRKLGENKNKTKVDRGGGGVPVRHSTYVRVMTNIPQEWHDDKDEEAKAGSTDVFTL
ncbi:unnamed protein product [Pleuronectes platessa]|uniref:Uncharacterized protein n=1 Tax=Pleuronectes platessa TaxID=8262 RepID=A0A9N7TJK4_PLEPL|nr:unnamed protein product [Pleuronectes platessa]